MNEKKAKRLRIEIRLKNEISDQLALLRYQTKLTAWELSEPPKHHIFKWLKWRLSKPKRRG